MGIVRSKAVSRCRRGGGLDEFVASTAPRLLDGLPDGGLFEDGAVAIAPGRASQAVAHIGHVDEALLDERVRLDQVPGLGSGDLLALVLGTGVLLVGGIDDAAIVQRLDRVGVVFLVLFQEHMGAGRGIAGRHGGRGRGGGVAAAGTQNLVLSTGAVQGGLQTLVIRLERVGAGLESGELGLELLDMALLALAKGTLAGGTKRLAGKKKRRRRRNGGKRPYAARFCALRLLWAGVSVSFSSLLLLVRLFRPSSNSAPMPESTLPTGMGVCAAALSGEPWWGVGRPLVKPMAS